MIWKRRFKKVYVVKDNNHEHQKKNVYTARQMEGPGIMVCGDVVLLDFGAVLLKFLF